MEGSNVFRDLEDQHLVPRQTYEALVKVAGTRKREDVQFVFSASKINHVNMRMNSFESMGKPDDPFFGNVVLDITIKLGLNLSQGNEGRGGLE